MKKQKNRNELGKKNYRKKGKAEKGRDKKKRRNKVGMEGYRRWGIKGELAKKRKDNA